jgi:hypothetical protein
MATEEKIQRDGTGVVSRWGGWMRSLRLQICGGTGSDGRKNLGLRGEEGQEVAEFTLASLFVFFPLLFAFMEMCLVLFMQTTAGEIARDTARYASVHATSGCMNSSGSCTETLTQITAYGNALPAGGLMTVTPLWCDSTGSNCNTTRTPAAGNIVQVKVAYTVFSLPFMPSGGFAVSSTARMVIWQ